MVPDEPVAKQIFKLQSQNKAHEPFQTSSGYLFRSHTFTANQVATMTSQPCGNDDSPISDRAKAAEEDQPSVVMTNNLTYQFRGTKVRKGQLIKDMK